jgi:hypothetical protein
VNGEQELIRNYRSGNPAATDAKQRPGFQTMNANQGTYVSLWSPGFQIDRASAALLHSSNHRALLSNAIE